MSAEEREFAVRELAELGIEALPENLEMVVSQRKTSQHPDGYGEILEALRTPEELPARMAARGIKSIVHSEGPSLWDHARLAISKAVGKDLALIFLYHDFGKTLVSGNEQNSAATAKKLVKGELHQSAIGHAEAGLDKIESGFRANGLEGGKLAMFMTVVKNHMKTSLLEQDPKKTFELFKGFGQSEQEIKETARLLVAALQIDGDATEHIDLVDGKLVMSRNEKKRAISFDEVWAKYKEGKKKAGEQAAARREQDAEKQLLAEIFSRWSGKLSTYLMEARGIEPGPDMGKASKKVQAIISANQGKDPAEILLAIQSAALE